MLVPHSPGAGAAQRSQAPRGPGSPRRGREVPPSARPSGRAEPPSRMGSPGPGAEQSVRQRGRAGPSFPQHQHSAPMGRAPSPGGAPNASADGGGAAGGRSRRCPPAQPAGAARLGARALPTRGGAAAPRATRQSARARADSLTRAAPRRHSAPARSPPRTRGSRTRSHPGAAAPPAPHTHSSGNSAATREPGAPTEQKSRLLIFVCLFVLPRRRGVFLEPGTARGCEALKLQQHAGVPPRGCHNAASSPAWMSPSHASSRSYLPPRPTSCPRLSAPLPVCLPTPGNTSMLLTHHCGLQRP